MFQWALLLILGGGSWLYRHLSDRLLVSPHNNTRKATRHSPTRSLPRLDAPTPEAVVQLVRDLSRDGDDTDALAARLERIYARFPPHENTLRRLSLFQQDAQGEGGEREFCLVLAYAVAILCVPRSPPERFKQSSSDCDLAKLSGAPSVRDALARIRFLDTARLEVPPIRSAPSA